MQIKTPEQNLIEVCKNKTFVLLENDTSLSNGLDTLYNIFERKFIHVNVLYRVSHQDQNFVKACIKAADGIVFQTTWLTETSKKLRDYVLALKKKKTIIECYLGDPTYYYHPNHYLSAGQPEIPHDIFIWKATSDFGDDIQKFHKLSDEPYWNYINKFDQ